MVELSEEEVVVGEATVRIKTARIEEEVVAVAAKFSGPKLLEEGAVLLEAPSMHIQGILAYSAIRMPHQVEVLGQPGNRMMPTLIEAHLPGLLAQSLQSCLMLASQQKQLRVLPQNLSSESLLPIREMRLNSMKTRPAATAYL
jgi:hypothetical protein